MKTFGIIATGSYYSPWVPFTLASIYAIVDGIVVVNAGFDLDDPRLEENDVPLREVSRDIEELDVQGKIIEVLDVSKLKRKLPLMSQKIANQLKVKEWYDLRGRNMTLASEVAYDEGANMVLRIDTDEVCYRDALGLRGRTDALILYQYEFVGNIGARAPNMLADPGPDNPFNDSSYLYPISKDDWYIGGLAPVIHADRKFSNDFHCAHLRSANPNNLSEAEKLKHFTYRFLYHLWTNEYGAFSSDLNERALEMALDAMNRKGKPSNVSPPEVCLVKPREYIEETLSYR